MAVILGAYELEGELGRGGMGKVFRARHLPTGAVRAVKVLDTFSDTEALARFRREAAVLAQGGGDGVVAVHECGVQDGRLYFAMDLMPRGSLDGRLKERVRLPWREAVALVASLGRSLARYHERAIVHRDLKPANVLFDEEDRPRLADFGLVTDPGSPALTESGSYLGTPSYSAPEQMDGQRVGPSADVFSLGVVLYQAVSGELPHGGSTLFAILNAARSGKRRSVAGIAGAPEQLDVVLAHALDPDGQRRYPDGAALARALEALLAGKAPERASRAGYFVAAMIVTLGVALGASFLVGPHPGHSDPPGAGPSGPLQPPPAPVVSSANEGGPEAARAALARRVHDLMEQSAYENADRACKESTAAVGTGFALALEAEVSLEAGDVEGALRFCMSALAANESEPRALAVMADVALRRMNRPSAIALATSAIACGDSVARARVVRCIAWSDQLDKVDQIIEDGKRALELQPQASPRLLVVLGKTYSRRAYADHDPVQAALADKAADRCRAAFEEASKRALRPDEALVHAAQAAWKNDDVEGAIAKASQAIALNSRRREAFSLRGHARARRRTRQRELEAGIADLERALALDVCDPEVRVRLSEALTLRVENRVAAKEDLVAALADAFRAVELDPGNPDAVRTRAHARRGTDRAGAIADLERFLEMARRPRDIEAARKELAELEGR